MPPPRRDSSGRILPGGSARRSGGGQFLPSNAPIELRGDIELRDRLLRVARQLNGAEMVQGMTTAVLVVERRAKVLAPVDVGRLRGSIAHEVRTTAGAAGVNVVGVVGTKTKYAAAVEQGSRPHWVPIKPLILWAKRHGDINPYALQKHIARYGTKAHPFLRPAFEQSRGQIIAILNDAVARIVR